MSLCHGAWGYHPTVRDRIDGNRLCWAWMRAAGDLDDVEL